MAFCLAKREAEEMKKALKDGRINPEKITAMTSKERRTFLEGIVGKENAKEVNLLFEKKLLLKNQQKAIIDWAKSVTGLSKAQKEATAEKIKQTYADKKRRVFEPKENEIFLNEIISDVFSRKFKTDISLEEAQVITELSSEASKAKLKMNEDFTWNKKEDGLDFGAANEALSKYVGALKMKANKRSLVNPFVQKSVEDIAGAVLEDAKVGVKFISSNARSIVASVDNSFWYRQGVKTFSNPKFVKSWAENFSKSFIDIHKTMLGGISKGENFIGGGTRKGDAIISAVKAEIFSRKNYLNGRYERGQKLDIGISEEEFPSALPEKIPVLGRLFKASEVAYTSGAMRMRADVADTLYELAEKSGVDLNDRIEVGKINEMANSLTGRGKIRLGKDAQSFVNEAFFSIKFFKSNLDFLFKPFKLVADPGSFTNRQAAKNLLTTMSVVGIIIALSDALSDDISTEWDPRSSDFCKIRVGDTRFDPSGGLCGLTTMAARIATGKTKSTNTGLVSKLGEEFGSRGVTDVFWDYLENKTSPMASAIKSLINRKGFMDEEVTPTNIFKSLTTPIIIETGLEAIENPNSAPPLLVILADFLGIGANTFTNLSEVEEIDQELLKLPPEEANTKLKNLFDTDIDLYKKVIKVTEDRKLEVTPQEKAMRRMGVKNGERAVFIFDQMNKLDTTEQRKAYLEDLKTKEVLNMKKTGSGQDVIDQINKLNNAFRIDKHKALKAKEEKDLIKLVTDYAKAFNVDTGSAFEALFTGEKLRDVHNDSVIFKRMGVVDSTKTKLERGFGLVLDEVKLDHKIPLTLGGDNSDENLQVISNELHKSYTSTETYLGRLLEDNKINKKEAQKAITDFKEGKITSDQIRSKYN